jgi:hypothetical protein
LTTIAAELAVRDSRLFGTSVCTREELELEVLSFDTPAYLTDGYRRMELAVLAGLNRSWGTLVVGPHVALLAEGADDAYTVGEDYVELGIKTQFDLIRPGQLLASLESITGRRDLRDEGTADLVQTDFTFERVNLLVDWLIADRWGVNLLLSTEWEWHEISSENNRMALFSSGLTYAF